MPNPLLGTIILSIVAWLGGYFVQKFDEDLENSVVAVPSWFRFLFGMPMKGGRMTIGGMTWQSIAYLSVAGAVVCEILVQDRVLCLGVAVGWIIFLYFCGLIWLWLIAPRVFTRNKP